MLVTDVVLCEDGHAQTRCWAILEIVRAKDVWIDDRNFCTTGSVGIHARGFFVVVSTPRRCTGIHGQKRACGRIETGKVFEQTGGDKSDTGRSSSRDGSRGPRQTHPRWRRRIHILTNLPKKAARTKTSQIQ